MAQTANNPVVRRFKAESGRFTNAGNFSAFDKYDNRIFISKRIMDSKGWEKVEDITFPFYALVKTEKIGQLDSNGNALKDENGVEIKVEREQASCVFPTKDSMIESFADDRFDDGMLEEQINQVVRQKASNAGLSEQQVSSLLALTI